MRLREYDVVIKSTRSDWVTRLLLLSTNKQSEQAQAIFNTAVAKGIDVAWVVLWDESSLGIVLKRFMPKVVIPVDEGAVAVLEKRYARNGSPIVFTKDYRAIAYSLDEETVKSALKLARMPKFAFSRRLRMLRFLGGSQ